MKKVGIVTFHCADNYGAVLQAYALSEELKKLKLNPEFIDFTPARIKGPYENSLNIFKNITTFGLFNGMKKQLSNIVFYKKNQKRIKNFNEFRNKYLKISEFNFSRIDQINHSALDYDIYVTGSDQVWNPEMVSGLEDVYFLNFGNKNAKKISYAASIAKELEEGKYNTYSKYLSKIDSLSIREDSHKKLIEKLSNKEVEVVVDPTLLHSKEFWNQSFNLKDDKKRYILVYDLIKEQLIIDATNQIAKQKELAVISYSDKKSYINWEESFKGKNPTKLLELIKNSEYIVTSSFHGMVFAIIFEKPFYVISHPTRGSRMRDLLEKLEIEDRMISSLSDINLDSKINYDLVNRKIVEMAKKSEAFLINALEK